MKQYLFIGALGGLAILGLPGFASPSSTGEGYLDGTVGDTCLLEPLAYGGSNNASLAAGATSSAATIDFTDMVDPATALFKLNNVNITLTVSGYCNYVHSISLQTSTSKFAAQDTGNLPTITSDSFTTEIDYNAVFVWADVTSTFLNTQGQSGVTTSNPGTIAGAYRGTGMLSINLANPNDVNAPLVAGSWSDTLTMQIGAAL
ncbi:hypothetical protein [Ponticaulis profundi]|uniref:Spore coat protein U domain-containing protein n=1 Tax=Ponticaulis profundi TaxID=2665222 RepID=A0ABW1SDK2_9PROT